MSQVDPYIVKIPQAFAKDPELQAWYTYTNRFLHDLWRGLTGGTGDTEVVEVAPFVSVLNQLNNANSEIARLREAVKDLDRRSSILPAKSAEFNSVTVTSSYTLNDYDFANVKSGATVTLPQFPIKNSVIIIRNGDGSTIKIDANGKKINGESSGKIYKKGTALTIQYFIDSDEWLIR